MMHSDKHCTTPYPTFTSVPVTHDLMKSNMVEERVNLICNSKLQFLFSRKPRSELNYPVKSHPPVKNEETKDIDLLYWLVVLSELSSPI